MNKIVIAAVVTALAMSAVVPSSVFAMDTMSGAMVSESNLMMSSRGDGVVWLQTWLEGKGYLTMPEGVAKGYFGSITKAALARYQAEAGLPSTGLYGPMTRAKLKGMAMMPKATDMPIGGIDGVMVGGAMMIRTRDIVDNAVLANNVTTVVAAVKAAGLVDTLKSAGPFTVFAPNNAAFAKLPAGTVDTLLKPENKSQLVDILTYHVVSGRYKMADLKDGMTLTTVEGKMLTVKRTGDKIWLNGAAMIETPDVISSNGVTHVIDTVLLPQ